MKAKELIQVRETLGFTQAEFANELGVSVSELRKLESSDGDVSLTHKLAIDMVRLHTAGARGSIRSLPSDLQSLVGKLGQQVYPG